MEKMRIATYIVDALVEEGLICNKVECEFEAWRIATWVVCYEDEMIELPKRAKEDVDSLGIAYQEEGEYIYASARECAWVIEYLLEYLDETEEMGEKMEKMDIVIRVVDGFDGESLIYTEDDCIFEAFAIAIKAVFKEDETIALPKCAKETLNRLGIVYQEESEKVHIRAWECADNIEPLYEYI